MYAPRTPAEICARGTERAAAVGRAKARTASYEYIDALNSSSPNGAYWREPSPDARKSKNELSMAQLEIANLQRALRARETEVEAIRAEFEKTRALEQGSVERLAVAKLRRVEQTLAEVLAAQERGEDPRVVAETAAAEQARQDCREMEEARVASALRVVEAEEAAERVRAHCAEEVGSAAAAEQAAEERAERAEQACAAEAQAARGAQRRCEAHLLELAQRGGVLADVEEQCTVATRAEHAAFCALELRQAEYQESLRSQGEVAQDTVARLGNQYHAREKLLEEVVARLVEREQQYLADLAQLRSGLATERARSRGSESASPDRREAREARAAARRAEQRAAREQVTSDQR